MKPEKEYRIKQGELFPLKLLCQGDSKTDFFSQPHWHDYMELIYVVKGNAQVVINGSKIELKANDIVFIDKNAIHSTKDLSCGNTLCFVVVFYPELVNSTFSTANEIKYINKFLSCFHNGNEYKYLGQKDDNKELSQIMFKMYNAFENKEIAYELEVKGLFYGVIANMIKNKYFSVADKVLNNGYEEKFEKVLTYINNHYMEDIDLSLIANKLDLSYFYFSKLFKSVVGKSFKQYLDYTRVNKAEKLILDENLSVSEASLKVGISDITCFSRIYKRVRGYSPSYFKNHIKKEKWL